MLAWPDAGCHAPAQGVEGAAAKYFPLIPAFAGMSGCGIA
jgi:hypothetical protein